MDISELRSSEDRALLDVGSLHAQLELFADRPQAKRVNPGVVLAGSDRYWIAAVGVAILRLFGTKPDVSRGNEQVEHPWSSRQERSFC